MNLVTYNMQHYKKGKSNWTKVFEEIDPDILLAQESLPPDEYQKPLFNKAWNENVVWQLVVDGWGSAVYVKGGNPQPLPLPEFHGWVVGVELEASVSGLREAPPIRVFSIHAPSAKESYQKAVGKILDMIANHQNGCEVIIGGDFNLTVGERHESEDRVTSSADRKIQERLRDEFGLINCWQAKHPDSPLPQTLRWDRDKEPPFHCDGLFVPKSWEPRLKSCEVLSDNGWRTISDHNPVVAEFD